MPVTIVALQLVIVLLVLDAIPESTLTCLSVIEDDPLLWHKRVGHASLSLLEKLRTKSEQ